MSRNRQGRRLGSQGSQEALAFGLVVLGIVLAWQVVRQATPEVLRPELALRIHPGSTRALTDAAWAELLADRFENAEALAAQALRTAPFTVRALRIEGMAAGKLNQEQRADDLMTLAGNWSLRDGPTHDWLVQRRLQQGRPVSAFNHSDAVLRRQPETADRYYPMFTAAASDPRGAGVVARLLALKPSWRDHFLTHMRSDPRRLPTASALAVTMRHIDAPMTAAEEEALMQALLTARQSELLRRVKTALDAGAQDRIVSGDFSRGKGAPPFGWKLPSAAGVLTEIALEPASGQAAMHAVVSDTRGQAVAAQILLLSPGRWRLTGRFRIDEGPLSDRLVWSVYCVEGRGEALAVAPLAATSLRSWTSFSTVLEIPAAGCASQWLTLSAVLQDHRALVDVWVDNVAVLRLD